MSEKWLTQEVSAYVASHRLCYLVGMRFKIATSALFFAAVSQFASAQAPASVATRLAAQNALFDDSWQNSLKMNPVMATAIGVEVMVYAYLVHAR